MFSSIYTSNSEYWKGGLYIIIITDKAISTRNSSCNSMFGIVKLSLHDIYLSQQQQKTPKGYAFVDSLAPMPFSTLIT